MTDILISVLNMSAAASIVAVAVIIARLPLTKAPKIFSYALWAVVFLRLVCPVNFESPASLMPTNAEIIPHSFIYESVPRIESGVPVVDVPLNQFIENSLPKANPAASVNPVQVALSIVAYAWLLGIAALLSYAVVGYIRLKRRVYDATIELGVFRTDKIATAFVLGLVWPKIYIPLSISGAQLEHILRHEQVHIKRRDYLIKPLAFIILAVHWFNPIVWISYYLMSKDMEMSCDEAVLRSSKGDLRQDYSMSLVKLYTRRPTLLSPLAFGEGSYNNMKARIKNVLNFKKAPRWAVIVCSLALVIFTVGFTTNSPQNMSADALIDNIANNVLTPDKEPLQHLGINASADNGAWAAAASIEGDTWQNQIDDEIKWLNDTYAENKTNFVITESLAASEAPDVSRINYLYDNSDVFRSMSVMAGGSFIVEDGQEFTRTGHSLTEDAIHRTAVMIENDSKLILDVDYSLSRGQMAVWLVDPAGTVAYQGNANTVYKGSRTVTGKKGLWSVIRVYDGGKDSNVSGNIAISLRKADNSDNQSYSPVNGSASLTGREPQPYFQIIGKDGSKNIASSGSFIAGTGQRLTIKSESGIKGGAVDLFLFSPSGKEQRFTFGSVDKTETVELTAGTWAYNCSGVYESGSIVITGSTSANLPISDVTNNTQLQVPYSDNTFLSNAWILNDFGNSANIILEFPEWYTEEMWDVDFIWGNYAVMPLNYDKSAMVGVGSDVHYELKVSFPDKEPIVIDLRELKKQLAADNKYFPDYYSSEDGSSSKSAVNVDDYGGYFRDESADEEAVRRMEYSGTWGDYINRLLPDMSPDAVDSVVDIYLDRHLFPNITTAEGARQVAETIKPALEYMTEEAKKSAINRIEAFY